MKIDLLSAFISSVVSAAGKVASATAQEVLAKLKTANADVQIATANTPSVNANDKVTGAACTVPNTISTFTAAPVPSPFVADMAATVAYLNKLANNIYAGTTYPFAKINYPSPFVTCPSAGVAGTATDSNMQADLYAGSLARDPFT